MGKILSMAITHMSLGTIQGAEALVTGVLFMSTLLAGEWARDFTPAIHYFSTCITTTYWHQDPLEHAVLGISE